MSDYIVSYDENGSPSLAHYGVLGMKWGVRHNPQRAYEKASKKVGKFQRKIEKHDEKARKRMAKGAAADSRVLFRSPNYAQKQYAKSRVQSARAVKTAQKGSKWVQQMEKEFGKQSVVTLDPSIITAGQEFMNRVSRTTNQMYLRHL